MCTVNLLANVILIALFWKRMIKETAVVREDVSQLYELASKHLEAISALAESLGKEATAIRKDVLQVHELVCKQSEAISAMAESFGKEAIAIRKDVSQVHELASKQAKAISAVAESLGKEATAIRKDVSQVHALANKQFDAISTLAQSLQKAADVIEEAGDDIAFQSAELKTTAEGMRLDTAGVKGAFLMAASRIAAIADAAGGKLPAWIKEKTSIGKVLDVENSATGERLEFDYLDNGDIKSRTFRGDILVCEILHDSNGGVKEGIAYSLDGKPQKRFVYDAMGQVKEQEEVEG